MPGMRVEKRLPAGAAAERNSGAQRRQRAVIARLASAGGRGADLGDAASGGGAQAATWIGLAERVGVAAAGPGGRRERTGDLVQWERTGRGGQRMAGEPVVRFGF